MSEFVRSDVIVHDADQPGFDGVAWLIEVGDTYYVVSSICNEWGTETRVFTSDSQGEVSDWSEVVVVYEIGHEAAIRALLEYLDCYA